MRRNVNLRLRQEYYNTLQPLLEVPMYWLIVPNGFPDKYVVITAIQSNDAEQSKCEDEIESSVTVTVYSRAEYNDGMEVDAIADIFLENVGNVPGTEGVELVSDGVSGGFDVQGGKQVIERTFIIKHIVTI